jgi:hypothetical protein
MDLKAEAKRYYEQGFNVVAVCEEVELYGA